MDIDAIHKALANPIRREILTWLKDPAQYFPAQTHSLANGVCAGQIDERCGLSQSTFSAHLATLQKAVLADAITQTGGATAQETLALYARNTALSEGFKLGSDD